MDETESHFQDAEPPPDAQPGRGADLPHRRLAGAGL
jgi:hypothetical protein